VCESPGCVAHIKCTESIRRPHLCRVFIERTSIHGMRGPQIIPSQSNHHSKIPMHLYLIKILRSHMDPISESFPVNPRPDGAVPVNRHSKSPIDATRALIGRALVLMTLNPFERVAVSLKLVSILLHYSSPPTSLVFAVFSCEQNLNRPSSMEFEFQEKFDFFCSGI